MESELKITRVYRLPLQEVSGLALRRTNDHATLYAIGDDCSTIVTANVKSNGKITDLKHRPVGESIDVAFRSQWEAIAADCAGRLFVLQETPGCVLVLNRAFELIHRIELVVDANRAKAPKGWLGERNSRGEGLLLLSNGHLLIVKEKHPPMLVEFGPRGAHAEGLARKRFCVRKFPLPRGRVSEYVPLKAWSIESTKRLRDVSDLDVCDGKLYLISDEEGCLVRLRSKLRAKVGSARVKKRWVLPKIVKKPEGLVLFGRVPIIAIDQSTDKENLFVFEPLGFGS